MTTHIRIPAVQPTVQAVADGTSRTYEFPFPVFGNDDLEVFVGDTLVATGFAVRGAGSSDGGAVTFATVPAAGQRVTIRRRQTYARTDDFLDERAPTPHKLNDAIDQNVAAIQELADESALAVKRAPTADRSRDVNLTLPEPEAGKVLGWNGSADALVNLAQVDVSDMLRKSQNLADLPDKAQARINLGLGSAATHAETDFATAAQGSKADSALQASEIGVSIQAHDADLDWLAANVTGAGKALIDDADAAAQRVTLGLGSAATHAETDFATAAQGAKADSALQSSEIGVSIQAHDADLDWLAANVTNAGKALLDDADAAAQRVTLGLGSAATKDVGTAANQVVQLDASGKLPAVDGSALTNLSVTGSSSANIEIFAAPGIYSWVVPAGVTSCLVEIWGGGGGGGAGYGGNNYAFNPHGGAGGGYAFKRVSGLTPGQSISVTVGAGGSGATAGYQYPNGPYWTGASGGNGGTSSFGSYCSATGGGGGTPNPSMDTPTMPPVGGSGVGGDVNLVGQRGGQGLPASSLSNYIMGGLGAPAPIGGAQSIATINTTYLGFDGANGFAPGGGGSATSFSQNLWLYTRSSGAGAPGMVRISY